MSLISPPKAEKLYSLDPYLKDHEAAITQRYHKYQELKAKLESAEGSLEKFSQSYKERGFVKTANGTMMYREWAPEAQKAFLIGDFNNWNRDTHEMSKNDFGVFEIEVSDPIPHESYVKVSFDDKHGNRIDRIPAWITYAKQRDNEVAYTGVFYDPQRPYTFEYSRPIHTSQNGSGLRIYEAHVGISSSKECVATFNHFTDNILPRIAENKYNAIQLMAVMEHAYYGSFGYQITSFFAVSSRYGTPDDLRRLIDTAHKHGIIVLLDVVHSHASKNVEDGLNRFDGSNHCYFHDGDKGSHELWDSKLFNYGSWEVLRFLLSNLRYWMDEYMFDGFRFDGVTSMLYTHHGIGTGFSGGYNEYFGPSVDEEAVVYMMLANDMLHELYKQNVVTIAEDVSGMPALCRPVDEGGLGFDYRLAMAVPDKWIELLKECKDEDWDIGNIVHTLTNRRHGEKTIAYAESHDQALVGDKTLAFWLMDKEMYTHMSKFSESSSIIDRGIALHKMIRFLTYTLAGEGYLNFIGNEWGHPEWLDFPRVGNDWSYRYARRQWNLVDNDDLIYKFLNRWDQAMNSLEEKYHFLDAPQAHISRKHEGDKLIAYERAGILFVFNFHHSKSFEGYRIGIEQAGSYQIVLSSDDKEYGGHGNVDTSTIHSTQEVNYDGRQCSLQLYIPSRTCTVLARVE